MVVLGKEKPNFKWQKNRTEEPVEYVCGICEKIKADRVYYQLGICKNCERVIRAFVPTAAEKTVAQISEEDLKKIKYLFKRGVSPKRISPVCRICGTKRKSFKEMSDPVNLICIDCYNTYVKTMLPQGRWALNRITLLDTEFKHMRDAYIHDKYGEDDKKKLEWFLKEYGGELPTQEHMETLVGKEQALRIRIIFKERQRAERERLKAEQRLRNAAKAKQFELLKEYDQIMPKLSKLIELVGNQELAESIDQLDKKRRCYMYRKMTPIERKEFRQKRKEIRLARGF